MSRAPNLSGSDIETVVGVLDGWTGKLTWERLIAVLAANLRATYTRQALSNHARIADGFDQRKKGLRVAGRAKKPALRDTSPEMQVALQRLERVEAEKMRLTAENERLLVQFALWLYNAEMRGLTKEQLSAPMPAVHREPTVLGKRDGRSAR
jgi:hypothetical protein